MDCMTEDGLSLNRASFGLTSFHLKAMASFAMLLDHIGYLIIVALIKTGYPLMPLYYTLRAIGRLAMPIYCYFVAFGVTKTSNSGLYAARMLCFAIVSEVPYNLMTSGSVLGLGHQNVMFTLLLGMLSSMTIKYLSEKKMIWAGIFTTAGYAILGHFCHVDYGMNGVLCVTAMYLTMTLVPKYRPNDKWFSAIGVFVSVFLLSVKPTFLIRGDFANSINLMQLPSLAAVLPLFLFNGQKGKQLDHVIVKYFFYAFYPLHMLMLVFIKLML